MVASDVEIARVVLHEIATHAYNLAMGLQNAAPPQATISSSIVYLREISVVLENISQKVAELTSPSE